MQHDRGAADPESWIEASVADPANRRCPHQWHHDSSSVAVKLRGLHHNHKWNGFLVPPGVPVDIKLSHQSDEYSSAIESDLELNLFHIATVVTSALVFSRRSLRSRPTNSASSDSTTAERLSVIDLAWFTRSSFKVRLTGRLRASALKSAFMLRLRYAHYMRITGRDQTRSRQ